MDRFTKFDSQYGVAGEAMVGEGTVEGLDQPRDSDYLRLTGVELS